MRIPDRVRAIALPQFDVLNEVASGWRARGADVITLGQALPGFRPPPAAVDALKDALEDPATHIYSADAGMPELRQALAAALSARGGRVDPDREVIITAGGNQAFQLALTTLVQAGDEVVLASPYFLNHEMAVRSIGALPVEAPVPAARAFQPRWDDLAPHVTIRTRAVVLVSPSNPTGAVIARADLEHVVAECASRDVIVIVDETYMHFVYDDDPSTAAALPGWADNVVVVGSFSKSYAITGWRCGYLLAHGDAIAEALKIQDCMVICAPVPVQRAVTAVLQNDADYPKQWLEELKNRRDSLLKAIEAIDGLMPIPPSGGFFVMVKVAGCHDSRAFALQLIEAEQVVTIPGRFFGECGEGYLRLSYGAAPPDRLRLACERIGRFVRLRFRENQAPRSP